MIVAANAIDAGTYSGVSGSAPLTAEALVTAAPDVILTTTSGLQVVGGLDGLLKLPGVAQTAAGTQRWVVARSRLSTCSAWGRAPA